MSLTKARGAESKLERAAAYHQAVPLLSEMELLNQRRVVVHPQGLSWDFFASSLQVQREEEETMRTIQINWYQIRPQRCFVDAYRRFNSSRIYCRTGKARPLVKRRR